MFGLDISTAPINLSQHRFQYILVPAADIPVGSSLGQSALLPLRGDIGKLTIGVLIFQPTTIAPGIPPLARFIVLKYKTSSYPTIGGYVVPP